MFRFLAALVAVLLISPAAAQGVQWRGPMYNAAGTITTGGAAQTVLPSNTGRHYLTCVNPTTATEVLYVDFGTPAAAATGIPLAAGGSITFASWYVPTDYVSLFAATTGHAFTCKWG